MERSKDRRRSIKKPSMASNPAPRRGLMAAIASFFFGSGKSNQKNNSVPSKSTSNKSGKSYQSKGSSGSCSKGFRKSGRSPASSPASSISNNSFTNMPRPSSSIDAEENRAVLLSINLGLCEGGSLIGPSPRAIKKEGKQSKRSMMDRENSASSNLSSSSAVSSNSNISVLSSLSGSMKAPSSDALPPPPSVLGPSPLGGVGGKAFSPTAAAEANRLRSAARSALIDSADFSKSAKENL